ncbi:hypothetical protein L3V86_08805 [Thiotrichales bacterium 19S11-10]|nr:hypothetical protein [Thiotrichales bacterium 19S11-10]MCF6808615.1 hypothetical protein [Thiotrichales bacterium 19S9-11]MCF6812585.1 hypothetical protein [Thiotrichales bacterium 19S9-12]
MPNMILKNMLLFIIGITSFSQVFAVESLNEPKVLLSGSQSATLNEQLKASQPIIAEPVEVIQPVDQVYQKPSMLYQAQVDDLNQDINQVFKKITAKASSLPNGQIADLYLKIKSLQQDNILLQQQNKIMDELALLNENIKVLIQQNNIFLEKQK